MTELYLRGVARHQDPGNYPSGGKERQRDGPPK
jgi:hypothetical protein